MKSEARDTSHPIHSPSLAATGPVPTGLWGTAIRSHPVARSGGRERLVKPTEGWSEELAAPRWGEVSTKRRRRGLGLGAGEQDPRERTGGADKRERQPAPAPDQPPRETPRHPARPGPPGSPRQPAGVTDADRRGPQSERVAPHPQGARPGGGAGVGGSPVFSPLPPASLPLMAR